MDSKPVNANSNWKLATTDAYAKSTEMGLRKTVDDHEAEVDNDVLKFTLDKMTIPSYSDQYTSVKYEVVDTIVNGLAYTDAAPVVKVGGKTLKDGAEYDLTKEAGANTFKVSFKQDYIKSLANAKEADREVVITYSATVTDAAIVSSAENTATVTYTSTPGQETTKTDKEYVYTFELNGILKKVQEDQETALPDAVFTLYRDAELTDVFDTYKTTSSGDIVFQGLDADRTYYLKETEAPRGYTLNDNVYAISFTNLQYGNDGKLVSYDVNVNGEKAATISYGVAASSFHDVVVNTTISTLPGTGGIGTTIFTIGGCLIMIIAAALFFASRKKQQH